MEAAVDVHQMPPLGESLRFFALCTLLVYPSLCLCVGAVIVYRIDGVITGLDKQKPGFVSIAFDDGDTESHDLVGKRFRWK